MRYSAIIKFFAVVLCAAVILSAIGSGAGLLALTECGLYSRSFEDFYHEEMEYKVQSYGHQVAGRYASLNLGGADQRLANDFYPVNYSFFEPSRIGYVLKDADGKTLQTQELSPYTAQQTMSVTVEGQYMKVLKTEPVEEAALSDLQPEGFGNAYVTKCPETTVSVVSIIVDYSEGSQDNYVFTDSAILEPMEDGSIRFYAENMEPLMFAADSAGAIRIQFFGEEGRIVYEARGSSDVESWYYPQEYRREGTTKMILPGKAYLHHLSGTTLSSGDFTGYDAIPAIGSDVAAINVSYGTLEEGTTASEGVSGTNLGYLLRDGKGNPRFEARQTGLLDIPEEMLITSISFLNENGELLYEANCPSGVGTLAHDINGYLVFQASIPGLTAPEETHPEDTASEMENLRGVVRRNTDIYSMPSLTGRKVGIFTAGSEVMVLQQESIGDAQWALVDRGWINMSDLVLEQAPETESQGITEPAPEPVQAMAKENVNIYSMPNAENPVGMVEKGDTVTVLKEETYMGKNWALTDTGWVQMEFLTIVTAVPMASEDLSATATQQAISGVFVPEEVTADAPSEEPLSDGTLPEEILPDEPLPRETVPAEAEQNVRAVEEAQEDPLAGYDPARIQTYSYYDHELGQSMEVSYVMEPLPGYTLELQLAAGADRSEMMWMLLGIAYALRDYLLMILGGSLALLGLCVVYLCCAAAHKRGSDVIRAGGLNRIPLDGYLALDGCLLTGFVLLGYEGTEYFLHNGLNQIGLGLLAGSAYVCSLLLVGFGFAFVAQIKTPRGYWWRNSLCGRMVLLIVRLCRRIVVFCGSNGWSLVTRAVQWLRHFFGRLFLFGKITALRLWDVGKRLGLWTWDLFGKLLHWISGNLARIFGLLPITWQFLATGFTLVVLLYVMMRTYKVGYILLGFGIFFAVILYAASAFAILLENAKRMSKGDLDTKVDDRMLIGGFREFAQRLNDLAGVAVIAAQKQLKSERMKTELITNVSHDIKTPLTSIINYVDLLRKPHTPEQQEQYLEVLDRQSQRLKKLIDDLMEMSKASTGNMAVDIEKVDAAEAVNQALGEFADKLERAQLTPVFRQPDEPVYMLADGRLVWRVMSNILGNAVKYALPGTRIYLDLIEMDGKVVISMKNISREELNVNADELMERFVRGDASRNTEGSGLGLNIAQSLMELQRGQLRILVDGDLFKVTLIFCGA